MLLPHGFEGQGPEHSSARLERFLNLGAEDNIQVVNLTTPAQLFHCLRRQVLRPWRKPLVVMAPKRLLRLSAASSSLDDLASGSFHRILPEPREHDPSAVRRILLTSGKLYYELEDARREAGREDLAIIRLEQYYPLSEDRLLEVLSPYADGIPGGLGPGRAPQHGSLGIPPAPPGRDPLRALAADRGLSSRFREPGYRVGSGTQERTRTADRRSIG